MRTGRADEAGDDEARVGALRSGLDASDDALHPVPACRAVVEFLEPAQLRAIRQPWQHGRLVLSSRLRTCLRSVDVGATPSV